MVDGVRKWIAGAGVTPKNFFFEKFADQDRTRAKHET
jgi:hypothetical protein